MLLLNARHRMAEKGMTGSIFHFSLDLILKSEVTVRKARQIVFNTAIFTYLYTAVIPCLKHNVFAKQHVPTNIKM